MTPWASETAVAPEVAALPWHHEVRLHKHEAAVDLFPAELQAPENCQAVTELSSTPEQPAPNSLMLCSRVMGTPKLWGWGSAHSCDEHTRKHPAQCKGPVKCSAPAALKVSYNLPWKKHGMTVRCGFRAPLTQNTWSFSQQALKTGMAQSFRQELQKQIPSPFQVMSLWSKGEFYPSQCLKVKVEHTTAALHQYSIQPAHPDPNQSLWSQKH